MPSADQARPAPDVDEVAGHGLCAQFSGTHNVAATARAAGIGFCKQGNCFTRVANPAGLARVADTLSQPVVAARDDRATGPGL
jgi:hypothetical protein